MATRLNQVLTFTDVGIGETAALPHSLNLNGRALLPDFVFRDNGDFSITSVTLTTVTVTNNGTSIASLDVWLWYQYDRLYGASTATHLAPHPFIPAAGASSGGGGGGGANLPVYNISDYGATDPANPVTTRAAMTAVMGLVNATGGEIFIPPGEWELTRESSFSWALKLTGNNYKIFGIRGRSFFKLTAGQSATPCILILVDGNQGITFQDIGFDGNWGNGRTSVAMSMVGLQLPQAVISVAEGTDNFDTSGTFFLMLPTGEETITYTGKTSTSFTGCSGGTGIIVEGAIIGRQDSVLGINHATQGDPQSHGVMVRGASDIFFDRCQWKQCYGDGVWVGASVTTFAPSKHVKIVDGLMDVCARDGVALAGICEDIIVDRSRITNIFAQAFDCEPVDTWVRDIVVSESFLDGWWNPGNPARSANAAVSIVGGKNSLQGPETNLRHFRLISCEIPGGVIIHGCIDVVVRDCRLYTNFSGIAYPLIYISEGCDDVWIVDNYIYDRTTELGAVVDASIVATYSALGTINVQPSGVHIIGNRVHSRNTRNGIRITGPGGGAVFLGGDQISLPDESGVAESIDFSTTVAAGSNGAVLPQAVINVVTTTGAPDHGMFRLTTAAGGTRVIQYTGKTATSFTGCSGGSGAMATGNPIGMSVLTDNDAAWAVDQWANFRVSIGDVAGLISSNTTTQLSLYESLSDKSFFPVSGWGDPYDGQPVLSPAAGAYSITAPPRGMVTVERNEFDGSDDGNGPGGLGIIIEALRAQARVKVLNNVIKNATGAAITINGAASADPSPTDREFKFLEIANNHAYDDRETPATTAMLEFDDVTWELMVLRGNTIGVGVAANVLGLASGVWRVSGGIAPSWEGYGSPENVVTAPVGSSFARLDGAPGTSAYTKAVGVDDTGWAGLAASAGSTVPAYIEQLDMIGATFDPGIASSTAAFPASGIVLCTRIRCYSTSIERICFLLSVAEIGGTSSFLGIYQSDGTQTAEMATATVDAHASFLSTGFKSIALTNPVSVAVGDDIIIACLLTGSISTAPTFRGNPSAVAINGDLVGIALRNFTHGSGLSALPASIATSAGAGAQMPFYGLR